MRNALCRHISLEKISMRWASNIDASLSCQLGDYIFNLGLFIHIYIYREGERSTELLSEC